MICKLSKVSLHLSQVLKGKDDMHHHWSPFSVNYLLERQYGGCLLHGVHSKAWGAGLVAVDVSRPFSRHSEWGEQDVIEGFETTIDVPWVGVSPQELHMPGLSLSAKNAWKYGTSEHLPSLQQNRSNCRIVL